LQGSKFFYGIVRSLPPQDGDESNVPEVYLSASSFTALANATLVSLNNTCEVTGSDTSLIESDFNPEFHHSYEIVRWRPADLPPMVGVLIVTRSDFPQYSYLFTYRLPRKSKDCPAFIQVMLIDFTTGNRHWHHNRSAELVDAGNIHVSGECWHASDAEEAAYSAEVEGKEVEGGDDGENEETDADDEEGFTPVDVSIKKDGTLDVREAGAH
jgi:hypothetical protein